ncbi:hypothetical protein NE475_20390, partial [Ruthenibacterium lactatiformans]|nr:hypothetical protein [Ruthenibacterium lactatiformans]
IATRHAKNTASFLAAVQIRCIAIWCAEWQYHASISSAEKHSPTNDEADTNNGHTSAVICDLVCSE